MSDVTVGGKSYNLEMNGGSLFDMAETGVSLTDFSPDMKNLASIAWCCLDETGRKEFDSPAALAKAIKGPEVKGFFASVKTVIEEAFGDGEDVKK